MAALAAARNNLGASPLGLMPHPSSSGLGLGVLPQFGLWGEPWDGDVGCQGAALHTLLPLVGFCPLPQGCLWSTTTLEKEIPLGDVPVAIAVVSEFFIDVIFGQRLSDERVF